MPRSASTRAAIEVAAGLLEIDYGDWDGLTAEECRARDPELRAAWEADPYATRCPGGESGADVARRAFAVLAPVEAWLAADRARCAIVVAHNHVNRLRLCALLGWPMREYRIGCRRIPAGYSLVSLGGGDAGRATGERARGLTGRAVAAGIGPAIPILATVPAVPRGSMSIELSQQLQPVMQAKVTPKQIAANYILQMSSVELQEAIAQELDENPALEMEELPNCPICGSPVAGNYCTECMPRKGEADGDEPRSAPTTCRATARRDCVTRTTSSTRSRVPRPTSPSRTTSPGTSTPCCRRASTRWRTTSSVRSTRTAS